MRFARICPRRSVQSETVAHLAVWGTKCDKTEISIDSTQVTHLTWRREHPHFKNSHRHPEINIIFKDSHGNTAMLLPSEIVDARRGDGNISLWGLDYTDCTQTSLKSHWCTREAYPKSSAEFWPFKLPTMLCEGDTSPSAIVFCTYSSTIG